MKKNKQVQKTGTERTLSELETLQDIIQGRSGTHGDAFANLQDIAKRWSRMLNKQLEAQAKDTHESKVVMLPVIQLTAADVAYMMVEMKLSRATYGDNQEVDHFRDIMGYAAIGAAYTKANSPQEVEILDIED